MTLETLLRDCQQRGIRLMPDGDKLRVKSPVGTLDDELKAALSRFKTDLLALLVQPKPDSHTSATAVRFKLYGDQGGGTMIDPEGWESARRVLAEKYGARLERLWRVGEQEENHPCR